MKPAREARPDPPGRRWGIPKGAWSSEDLSPALESIHCRAQGSGKEAERDRVAITAAALVGLGTRRRRRRSLPANVPLTKRRRRQRRPCPSRDPYVTGGAEPLLEAWTGLPCWLIQFWELSERNYAQAAGMPALFVVGVLGSSYPPPTENPLLKRAVAL